MKRVFIILTAVLALAVLMTACGPKKKASGPPITSATPALGYVAIGASESVGVGADAPLRDAWTKVLWATAMPRETTFTDLAISGSTASDATTQQLPQAIKLQPNYITVWLNVNDIVAGVPASSFEASLQSILSQLKASTKARIFVANTPPLDQMPAYLDARNGKGDGRSPFARHAVPSPAQLNTTVDAYNAATARVAASNGATLVDLHALGLAARANGTAASLFAADGFHPSTAGHKAVANAFAAAIRP